MPEVPLKSLAGYSRFVAETMGHRCVLHSTGHSPPPYSCAKDELRDAQSALPAPGTRSVGCVAIVSGGPLDRSFAPVCDTAEHLTVIVVWSLPNQSKRHARSHQRAPEGTQCLLLSHHSSRPDQPAARGGTKSERRAAVARWPGAFPVELDRWHCLATARLARPLALGQLRSAHESDRPDGNHKRTVWPHRRLFLSGGSAVNCGCAPFRRFWFASCACFWVVSETVRKELAARPGSF